MNEKGIIEASVKAQAIMDEIFEKLKEESDESAFYTLGMIAKGIGAVFTRCVRDVNSQLEGSKDYQTISKVVASNLADLECCPFFNITHEEVLALRKDLTEAINKLPMPKNFNEPDVFNIEGNSTIN